MAFIKEMGYDIEPVLLIGAEDPDSNVTELDETVLVAINNRIRLTAGAHDFIEVMSTILVESEDEDGDGFKHKVYSMEHD